MKTRDILILLFAVSTLLVSVYSKVAIEDFEEVMKSNQNTSADLFADNKDMSDLLSKSNSVVNNLEKSP